MYTDQPVQTNVKCLLIVFVILIIAVVFFLGAISNEDLLWFLPHFNETPARIIVYRAGCRVDLVPGERSFDELTTAVNQSLSQVDGCEQGFGLSPVETQLTLHSNASIMNIIQLGFRHRFRHQFRHQFRHNPPQRR